jgi:3-oxoacyl-[acyl-carrier protein] reductase
MADGGMGNGGGPAGPIVVLVTGAARGIGRAMTLGLAAAGFRVGAVYRPSGTTAMGELLDIARDRDLSDRIVAIEGDVTRWADCAGAVRTVTERFGGIHGLVNNAGIGMENFGRPGMGQFRKFYEHDADAWREAIDININGAFLMAKAAAPAMVAQRWGRIVNIGTSPVTMTNAYFSPYGPSKAALEAATATWSKELAQTGVTVNTLIPGGPVNTRMIPDPEVPDRSTLLQPEIMVAPIVWLMSPQSDGITGRRFVAGLWDVSRDPAAAAQKAGAQAGWS